MADVIFIEVAGIVALLKPNVTLLHETTRLIGFPFYEGDLFGEHLITQVGTFQLMKPAAEIQNEITDHATTTIDLIDRKK